MLHRLRSLSCSLGIATLVAVIGAGTVEAQDSDVECAFDRFAPAPVHLSPGETAGRSVLVTLRTNAPVEALPPYQWRLGPSELVTGSPDRGPVDFRLWEEELLYTEGGIDHADLGAFGATIDLGITAGQRPGSEHLALLVYSADEGAVPSSCQRAEVRVPVAVGGEYVLTASHTVPGTMTTVGEWLGTFSVVDGDRIRGDGTITTTLTGSCVRGTGVTPMRISGSVVEDVLHVTVVGEQTDEEPETESEQSMECIVRTLRELPGFFEAWAVQAATVAGDPCPLEVPVGGASVECAGVTYHVRRIGGD